MRYFSCSVSRTDSGLLFFRQRIVRLHKKIQHFPSREKRNGTSQYAKCPYARGSGTAVLGAEPLIVDVSHTDQGYIMAQYTGDADKANIQIDGPDGINYKYFITSGPM